MTFEGRLYYNAYNVKFEEKVRLYTVQYQKSVGKLPKTCKVHPSMTEIEKVDGITIEKTLAINPNYFWIGEEIEDT